MISPPAVQSEPSIRALSRVTSRVPPTPWIVTSFKNRPAVGVERSLQDAGGQQG